MKEGMNALRNVEKRILSLASRKAKESRGKDLFVCITTRR